MKKLDKQNDFRNTSAYGRTFPDLTFKESVDVLIDKINELIELNQVLVKYIYENEQNKTK